MSDKREPLLSDDGLCEKAGMSMADFDSERGRGARWIRAFYEDRITKGELQVVKTAKQVPVNNFRNWVCEDCNYMDAPIDATFCPGCRARIVSE